MAKTVLVTGGSSGIGLHTALALSRAGCTVYELSRTGADNGNIIHIDGDVTKEDTIIAAVDRIIRREGRMDILINNAGFGISGAVEFTDTEAAEKQFDVNFFGMVRVCKAVIPHMRAQKQGKILNVSSVAAVIPIPFQTFYSASKAAVNSYTMALANELHPFGITVCAVMPGDISTGFTNTRSKQTAGDAEYAGRISRSVSKMEHDELCGMSPEKAGEIIAHIALGKSRKPLHTVRLDYKIIAFLQKILPAQLLNFIIRLLYAK